MANKLIITNVIEDKNKLEHYGVKGMKWGVRKAESETQGPQVKGLETLLLTAGILAVQIVASNIGNKKAQSISDDPNLTIHKLKDAKKIAPPESYAQSIKNTNNFNSFNKHYKNNCPNTTLAYELRRRGYDVKAKPNTEGLTMSKIKESYKIKETDLQIGQLNNPAKVKKNNEMINNYFQSMPEGYRGAVSVVWERSYGGHIFNVEKVNNKVMFIDSQSGKSGEFKKISFIGQFANELTPYGTKSNPANYLYKAESVEFFRTDTTKINEEYLSKQIMKG